jgi:hypothetical protein
MPIVSRISPNFSDEKLRTGSLDDLIDVFEDRLRNWLLAPAKALLDVPFGELAALSLLLGYFEPCAIYRKGENSRGQSKAFFRAGFVEVFVFAEPVSQNLFSVASLTYFMKMLAAAFFMKVCCESISSSGRGQGN